LNRNNLSGLSELAHAGISVCAQQITASAYSLVRRVPSPFPAAAHLSARLIIALIAKVQRLGALVEGWDVGVKARRHGQPLATFELEHANPGQG
jgi:hypothetical protein